MEHEGQTGKDGLAGKLVVPLVSAITVALLGFFTSQYLSSRQALEARVQLYTQLISQREQSDSALRKDMFITIFQGFLRDSASSLDEQVLGLELLAYNFHESLNLKPLFVHLYKQISGSKQSDKEALLARLERLAREVSRKQLLVLEGVGESFDRTIDLDEVRQSAGGIKLDTSSVVVEGIKRDLTIYALAADQSSRELKLRLEVSTPANSGEEQTRTHVVEFWVNFYDFPMIDNTRLLHDQRVAVVLNSFDAYSADITVACFPGAYASLKEKPYIQEVVDRLLGSQHAE